MSSPPIIYRIIQDFQDNRKHDLHNNDCKLVPNNILSFAQSDGGNQSYWAIYHLRGWDSFGALQTTLHGTHSPTMDGGMGILWGVLPTPSVSRLGQAARGDRSTYCHRSIRTPKSSSSSYSRVFFLRVVRVFTVLLWLARLLALQVERKLFVLTLSK